MTALLGGGFELRERALPGGEVAALLLVPPFSADRVEGLLAEGRVQEVPLPSGYTGGLRDAIPHMKQRLGAIALEGEGIRAIGWPLREVSLQIRPGQVWGIPVAEIVARPPLRRTLEARGITAGAISPAAAGSATEFETLAELLLDAAPRELLLQRLGLALTRTSRQVNTLEHRVAPSLRREVVRARRTLEEREREEHTRLGWLMRGRR